MRKNLPTGNALREIRCEARYSRRQVAELLQVSVRTVRLWEAGTHRVPYAAYKLLCLMLRYEPPAPAWSGWFFRGDVLWSPTGQSFEAWGMSYLSLVFATSRLWLESRVSPRQPSIDKPSVRNRSRSFRRTRTGDARGEPVAVPALAAAIRAPRTAGGQVSTATGGARSVRRPPPFKHHDQPTSIKATT